MAIRDLVEIEYSARTQLDRLDHLLDGLEELNLQDLKRIPADIGSALQGFGVRDPYDQSITQLIDVVFDLQEPLLQRIRRRVRQD